MFAQQVRCVARTFRAVFERAFQNVRQKKSRRLKLRMNVFYRLSWGRCNCRDGFLLALSFEGGLSGFNPYGAKHSLPFSTKFPARRVQKLRVLARSNPSQQQRLDVYRTVARRPFQPAKSSRDMLARCHLPTPIAAENLIAVHVDGIVEEMQANCKLFQVASLDLSGFSLRRNSGVGGQLGAQAPLEFLAQLENFHARHDDELAAQHFARFVVIGQLAGHAAILAILVPAETAVRNGFRADELETAQERVALRHLELLSEDGDVNQLFVRTEGLRH